MTPSILHCDAQIVVVDKPSGLLSVPGRGPDKQQCVVNCLVAEFPGIREVHRLDWETSGIMLLARDPESHRRLSRQFQQRTVEKRYIAEVYGAVAGGEGEIALPLRCDWPNRPRQMVDLKQGKPSLTRWRLLTRNPQRSRLELMPVTGRSHQLRVHLQALGHPILGDPLYAHHAALRLADRLLLHATELTISHPASGERCHFLSPPPF